MIDSTNTVGVGLAQLNGFMKNYSSGVIVPGEYFWKSLYDVLKADVKSDPFMGDLVEQLVQTTYPFTGQAFGENVDIPRGEPIGYVKKYIPLKEIITNAQITKQAMDRAKGGSDSWGSVVDAVLRAQRVDFQWLMELCSIGDGTGRLARTVSAAAGTSEVVVTCDNTYADFGWENTYLMKKGMWIQAYDADGDLATDGNGVTAWKVTAVTKGNRNNGAATTGTFTIAVTTGQEATIAAFFHDNGATVYLKNTASLGLADFSGAYSTSSTKIFESANRNGTTKAGADIGTSLPMGLVGLIAAATGTSTGSATLLYTDGAIDYTLDTFQGLARASYPSLNAHVYKGTDYGGTDGTPSDWDLSVIGDAITQVNDDTGGDIKVLMCSVELAGAIYRRSKSENNITVNVSNTTGMNQPAVGVQIAKTFACPDGREIPIKVSKTIPRNVCYGLTTEDLQWYTRGNFDFLRLGGDVWDKTYDDRKANFEAPFGGYCQIGAERVDRCFVIQDLADNI